MSISRKEHRAQRRALLIDLLGGRCVNCGSKDSLEFDHVMPEDMSYRIATHIRQRLEIILPELQKCQLLCTACHIQKTNAEYRKPRNIIHGKAGTYTSYNCRCILCTDAWRIYTNQRYKRKSLTRSLKPV